MGVGVEGQDERYGGVGWRDKMRDMHGVGVEGWGWGWRDKLRDMYGVGWGEGQDERYVWVVWGWRC